MFLFHTHCEPSGSINHNNNFQVMDKTQSYNNLSNNSVQLSCEHDNNHSHMGIFDF